jgi:dipeptidyl aminopeptidase/acylaminoacyl peptidase
MPRLPALLLVLIVAAPALAWGDPPAPPGWVEGVTSKSLGLGNRGRGLTFTPDGKSVLTPELVPVDAATGKAVPPKQDRPEHLLGFDRAGHVLTWRVVRPDPTREPEGIEVYDATAGKVLCTAGAGEVNEVAISPDLSVVAVSSADRVGLWDAKTGKQLGALETRAGAIRYYVHALAFSPDGKNLAVGSGTGYPVSGETNGSVAVWDVATRKLRHVLSSPESQVNALAWSPDSSRLAGGGVHSSGLRVWDAATGKETILRYGGAGQFFDVTFSPDGKTVAANWRARGSGATDAGVVLWDVATGRAQGVLSGNREVVRTIAFSPDGRRLATLDTHGTVKVWEKPETVTPDALVKEPKKYEGRIVAVEGVLRETPVALQDKGTVRYAPDLAEGLDITCPGKPLVVKGDRVRVVGRFAHEEATFTEYTLRATSVTILPEKP